MEEIIKPIIKEPDKYDLKIQNEKFSLNAIEKDKDLNIKKKKINLP